MKKIVSLFLALITIIISSTDIYAYEDIQSNTYIVSNNISCIESQPADITVNKGEMAHFKIVANGSGNTYQWQYKLAGTNEWRTPVIASAKTADYSFAAEEQYNGLKARCTITNAAGTTVSNEATLTVNSKPVITSQPSNAVAKVGDTVHFRIAANGSGNTYQWQYKLAGTNEWRTPVIASAKTADYSFAAEEQYNGLKARCTITNAAGTTVSNEATLTVNSKPVITSQPSNAVAKVGDTVHFRIAANGSGNTYQWQYKLAGTNEWRTPVIASAKTADYSFAAEEQYNGLKARCTITNAAGTTVSNEATLTVNSKPVITSQPSNAVAKVGDTVHFRIAANGSGNTYQWQYKLAGTNEWRTPVIASAKTADYSFAAEEQYNGLKARCIITNAAGTTVSYEANLTVIKSEDWELPIM